MGREKDSVWINMILNIQKISQLGIQAFQYAQSTNSLIVYLHRFQFNIRYFGKVFRIEKGSGKKQSGGNNE
jgi:hypothetical protein